MEFGSGLLRFDDTDGQGGKGNADWPDKELNFLTFSIMQLN